MPADELKENVFDLNLSGLPVGQDVFFLGYPLNLATDAPNIKMPHPVPFINKGVFSGTLGLFDFLFVSTNNTYGYSGGPVLFFNYARRRWQVIGVVSGYLKQQNDTPIGLTEENSGIMLVSSIKYANDIIATIP